MLTWTHLYLPFDPPDLSKYLRGYTRTITHRIRPILPPSILIPDKGSRNGPDCFWTPSLHHRKALRVVLKFICKQTDGGASRGWQPCSQFFNSAPYIRSFWPMLILPVLICWPNGASTRVLIGYQPSVSSSSVFNYAEKTDILLVFQKKTRDQFDFVIDGSRAFAYILFMSSSHFLAL